MRPQVNSDHYYGDSYDSKQRFISYWNQINEIRKSKPGKILEIGIGNGFVSNYLKERNVNITTLDIDENLDPDIVGEVTDLPFKTESFDLVACYEVLEHLTYKEFRKALSEIYRTTKYNAVLSIPDSRPVYKMYLDIPFVTIIRKLIPIPRMKKPVHKFDGEHHWEIGKKGYPISRIKKDIQRSGFKIINNYSLFENPYHRFFTLKKE
jgi:predicted SAM-dependent methyltransferase